MPNIFGLILTCVIVVIVFSLLLFLLKRISRYAKFNAKKAFRAGLIQGMVIIHLSEGDCKFNICIL